MFKIRKKKRGTPVTQLGQDPQFVDQVTVAVTKGSQVFVITPHKPDSRGVYDAEKVAHSLSLLLNGVSILFCLPKAPKEQLSPIETPETPLILRP